MLLGFEIAPPNNTSIHCRDSDPLSVESERSRGLKYWFFPTRQVPLSPQPSFERGAKGGCGEDFLKPSLSDTDSV
ncbi:hypothetical protein CKA32_000172 [Geitlerinema sp. FC II]|nr:hypothetical protein CKA32_000172 [Geitlerinema sp. FC II]